MLKLKPSTDRRRLFLAICAKRPPTAGVAFWVLWDQFDHSAEWSKSQKLAK